MGAVGAEGIIVIVCTFRVKRCTDRYNTGVGYRSGGQSLIKISVIGAIHLEIFIAKGILMLAEGLLNSSVDLQAREVIALKTIIDYRGNSCTLAVGCGLHFYH